MTAAQAGTLGMSTLLASRGLGAIFGAMFRGGVAGDKLRQIRWIMFAGFVDGRGWLHAARASPASIGMAVLALVIAHAGGSAAGSRRQPCCNSKPRIVFADGCSPRNSRSQC